MINWHQIGLALAVLIAGCSGGPKRVKPPKIDISAAATQAIELYDTDHDGKLSETELAKCPGVLVMLAGYDTNHDKHIDADEFHDRLGSLLGAGSGATQLAASVYYQGRPLSGATVIFEPEPYLGDDIQPAQGITTNAGIADLGIPTDKAPAALKSFKLIQYGTYKVRITHPSIAIPAKYNTETTLGYETIPGLPTVNFVLNNK
jgi:hypothetical protein